MGSEDPSALFFVADGAAKERVQCRDSQRKKKQRLKVHTKCSETWKNGFELRKRRKYTIKASQNRVAKINFRTKSAVKASEKGVLQQLYNNRTTFKTSLQCSSRGFLGEKVLKFYIIHQNTTESLDHETLL